MSAADDLRDTTAALCKALSEVTGDGRWSAAAGILTGKRAGRRAVDDGPALRYAETLLAAGVAKTAHRACLMAARLFAPPHQIPATRDRLRKKLRTIPIKSEDTGERRA